MIDNPRLTGNVYDTFACGITQRVDAMGRTAGSRLMSDTLL